MNPIYDQVTWQLGFDPLDVANSVMIAAIRRNPLLDYLFEPARSPYTLDALFTPIGYRR